MLSVVLYSVFTFLCGFANTLAQFVVFRIFLGIGMGGVWSSGAALVSESWPASSTAARRSASCRAAGRSAMPRRCWSAGFVQPRYGWRAVFFIGILPALFTLWVQRSVKEPAIWTAASRVRREVAADCSSIFKSGIGGLTDRADADEHLHAVRVVGLQPLAAELPEVEPGAGRRGSRHGATTTLPLRHAGRDVGRLRHLRLHQRSPRPEEDLRDLPAVGRGAARRSTSRCASRRCC